MKEKIILRLIREYTCYTEDDFNEHFGVADKLILSRVVRKQAEIFLKNGASCGGTAFATRVKEI